MPGNRKKLVWETVKSNDTVADYKSYLEGYPSGTFAGFARNAIKRLETKSQVASVDPSAAAGTGAQAEAAKLPDPQVGVAGTDATESTLGWSRNDRREVQTRLNLSGHDVGRPDGAFGPKTRSGVSSWQAANGMPETGYFTAAQYALLTTQTATQYTAYMAEIRRKQQQAAASRSATPTRQTTAPQRQPAPATNTNNGGTFNPAGAAFIGGVVGGILGGAIGR
ncbi:peptidoglycan-binding domain-containing protein [Roseibium salinum]|nr:peptidoglycan-binding domain-containing protein [Roseibium salinum]